MTELSAPSSTVYTPSRTVSAEIREDTIMKRVFLSPAITILLLMAIFPLLWSVAISFTDSQRGGSTVYREEVQLAQAEAREPERVGFLGLNFSITTRNYARLFDDSRLHRTMANTIVYVFAGVLLQYAVGFGLALLLNQEFFGRNIFRVVFLMPMMMTPAAAAYAGRMMFDSTRSPTADFLREISSILNIDPIVVPWLTDINWAPLTVILIDSWQWIPFMTLLLLAAMQGIPDDIYEAARVDGASGLRIIRSITFPILLPISLTIILIRGLEIFKIVDVIVVLTGGGPGSATESLTMYIYDTALPFGNYSYAAAISLLLLVLVIIFTTVFLFLARRISRSTVGAR
ncbi:MAG: sugar ABC transporter permease [Anaerolineae bacterium]